MDLWVASGEHWVRLGVGQDSSSHEVALWTFGQPVENTE